MLLVGSFKAGKNVSPISTTTTIDFLHSFFHSDLEDNFPNAPHIQFIHFKGPVLSSQLPCIVSIGSHLMCKFRSMNESSHIKLHATTPYGCVPVLNPR